MQPNDQFDQARRAGTGLLMHWSVGPDGRLSCLWQADATVVSAERRSSAPEPLDMASTWLSIAS
jgi:hypothetical protein